VRDRERKGRETEKEMDREEVGIRGERVEGDGRWGLDIGREQMMDGGMTGCVGVSTLSCVYRRSTRAQAHTKMISCLSSPSHHQEVETPTYQHKHVRSRGRAPNVCAPPFTPPISE